MVIGAVAFILISTLETWDYITGTSDYRHGHYSVIEGRVRNFRPLPRWVH